MSRFNCFLVAVKQCKKHYTRAPWTVFLQFRKFAKNGRKLCVVCINVFIIKYQTLV